MFSDYSFYQVLLDDYSPSRSEPDIANSFWRRSRRKTIAEQRTASSRSDSRKSVVFFCIDICKFVQICSFVLHSYL